MQRTALTLVFLFVCSLTAADEKVVREEFDGTTTQKWLVIRKDRQHVSLNRNKGCLTITTQRGTIHGDEKNDKFSEGTQAKNIHLLEQPVAEDSDFVATLLVRQFKPELFYHQVGIIVYRNDDNYVKWSMEKSNADRAPTKTVLVCERNASPTHHLITEIEIDGPFALRLERFGTNWICSHSLDGKRFQVVDIKEWTFPTRGPEDGPLRVGFLAKNGGNPAAPEIDVLIDSFELKMPEAAFDKNR